MSDVTVGSTTKPTKDEERSKLARFARAIGNFLLKNWLIFGFGIACVLAYFFPSKELLPLVPVCFDGRDLLIGTLDVAARGGIIRSEYSVLYGVVGLIFFINGMQLSPEKLKQHITNWRLHALVQGISFIIIPIIMLILIHIIVAAGGVSSGLFDPRMLMGMMAVSAIPTTVASNVVMTRNAGGDEAAAIIEVVIGNVLGPFLAPALIYGFLPADASFDSWRPAAPSTMGPLYVHVMKQLGLSVLLPLAVGQALRWTWSKKVEWVLKTFRLAKVCSLGLVVLIWSTFSGAFKTGAFYLPSKSSIAFDIVMNLVLYALFTVICFFAAYPPQIFTRNINKIGAESGLGLRLPRMVRRALTAKQMPKAEVIAVCFCGAAKTTSVGIPLADAMWSQHDDLTKSLVQVPILLYTTEQVFVAQFLTIFFQWWLEREDKARVDELEAGSAPATDPNGKDYVCDSKQKEEAASS
ncbi:sodium bile acid cotransporter [Apiospora kogelbergensis]|uniref:sodium bile acid cotransporter n=1 Tax=Apiospora kogelbergensis TaxID=1337665 RepID=UPI0031306D5C